MRPEERPLDDRELDPRSHPAPRSKLAVALGALTLLALIVALAVKVASPRPTNVPLGIAGFRLGSTFDEAKRQAPELGSPGLDVKGTLFEQPATCKLGFVPGDKLARIDCLLAPPSVDEPSMRRNILVTLRELYGKESLASSEPGLERWIWRNPKAELMLEARGDGTRLISELSAK